MNDAKGRRTAALQTPTNLNSNATQDISGALNALLADVFALYMKTKNFHWLCRSAFPRLPSSARRAVRPDFRHDRRHRRARPQDRRRGRSTRSATSRVSSVSRITTPNSSLRSTCWRNCATTTSSSARRCARFTTSATSTATSLPRACSKTGSTKPSGGPGSCSSRPVPGHPATTNAARARLRSACLFQARSLSCSRLSFRRRIYPRLAPAAGTSRSDMGFTLFNLRNFFTASAAVFGLMVKSDRRSERRRRPAREFRRAAPCRKKCRCRPCGRSWARPSLSR